ncbi:MAG: aminopeptidase P N-terminal domain-containing protein, partial [Bacteroidales bacterium]
MRITDGFTGTILLLVPFLFTSPEVSGQSPNEFQERRDAVIGKMEPNSVMILSSGEAAGTFNFPRVGGFFYYLTGLNEPDAYLVLHGRSTRPLPQARMGVQPVPHEPEILFIEPVDMSRAN